MTSERIGAVFAEASAAWPGVALEREVFERALAEHGEDELHHADLFLALACAAGDARALGHFERAFMSAVPRAVAHIAKRELDRDEVCQRLRQKLLVAAEGRPPRIADYSGRGPLAGWLRVAAVREALNLRRGEKEHDELALDDVDPNDGPEAAMIRARYGRALAEAFRESVRALPPDERTLLRLHYLDGLEIEQIGRVLAVHRSTASRWLSKTREAVLKETRRRVREQLRASASEVESVLRLAGDDLEISLHRALGSSSA